MRRQDQKQHCLSHTPHCWDCPVLHQCQSLSEVCFLLHSLSKRGTCGCAESINNKKEVLWRKEGLFSELFGDDAMDMWAIINTFHNEDKAQCEVASAKITSEVFFSSNGLQIIREAVQRVDALAAESEH